MIARLVALGASLLLTLSAAPDGAAQTKVRVGWCAKTVSSAATPFAIATKMGWFKEDGVEVELVPLSGSGDCVKTVATREVAYALPSVEPQAPPPPRGRRESKPRSSTPRTRATSTASRSRRTARCRR